MSIWFTSDTHFGHFNCIRYCSRPFESVFEMNEKIIENWNRVVKPRDTIFHLGDFALCGMEQSQQIMTKLNGKNKILIRGNHDKSSINMLKIGFTEVHRYMEWKRNGLKIFLSHVPMTSVYHDVVICGHCHEKFHTNGNILNVGVDVMGFFPINWKTIIEMHASGLLNRKNFVPTDVNVDRQNER